MSVRPTCRRSGAVLSAYAAEGEPEGLRRTEESYCHLVSPLGCREQEQPKRVQRKTQQLHGKATADVFERVIEMPRNIYLVLYVLVLIAVIVGVDLLFLRHQFWARLIVNISIVLVFAAFYLRFLRNP